METLGTVAADPSAPLYHRFRSRLGEHVLIVPHSRLFDLEDASTSHLDELARALSEPEPGEDPLDAVVAPSPQSISLNVSSSCNLSCSYCYAARGSFHGAQSEPMKWETARPAIDSLLLRADPVHPITVGFLGGEPFVNRDLIWTCVDYATARGLERGLDVRFSVTTNGTLLRAEDIARVRSLRMAVTISIDGGAQVQNRQRPRAGAQQSFAALARAIAPLLAEPGRAQIAARATVTRNDLDLASRFHDILALGFSEVGFSPLRADGGKGDALRDADWSVYLDSLKAIACGEAKRLASGLPIRLSNFAIALKQIARGASSPYPCGAGGGYFSVGANGTWYACHRAIGSSAFALGDSNRLDAERRETFLRARHVHAQAPCNSCWARYLCSGACHQEAAERSEPSCDFIRGWLEFCLASYVELSPRAAPSRNEVKAHEHV
jgi:uncharacterized protein